LERGNQGGGAVPLVVMGEGAAASGFTGALLAVNSPIPNEWVSGLCDYPISRTYLEQLAHALEPRPDETHEKAPTFSWVALPFRNLVFLVVVLTHVCLRGIF
jgi:hypothetical protein